MITTGPRLSGLGGRPVNSSISGSSDPNDSFPSFQLARATVRTSRMRLGVTPSPVEDQGRPSA